MGATNNFSEASLGSVLRFVGGFRRIVRGLHEGLEDELNTAARGLSEIFENLKAFARSKIKLGI